MKKIYTLLILMTLTVLLVSCGNKEVLNIYLPNDYVDKSIVKEFGREHGVRVKINNFNNNEVALSQIQANVYDVVVPSDYAIEELANKGLIEKINYLDYVDSSFEITDGLQSLIDYLSDGGFELLDYAVPYFYGTIGVLYNHNVFSTETIEQEGFNIITDSSKRTVLYDSSRDSFMIGMLVNGKEIHDSNRTAEQLTIDINEAETWLKNAVKKNQNTSILSDEILTDMLSGTKFDAVVSYSGDAAYIMSMNDNYTFYNPDNTNFWVDGFVIPKNSTKKELAKEFIKFMTSYDAALANTLEVGYTAVRKDVYLEVTKVGGEYNEARLKYAYEANLANFQVFRYDAELKNLIDDAWSVVLASQNK